MRLPWCALLGAIGILCGLAPAYGQTATASVATSSTATPPPPAVVPKVTSEAPRVAAKNTDAMTLDELVEGKDLTGTPKLPPREPVLPPVSAEPGEDRPLPNYDGRASEGTNAAQALIWLPRVVFFPVHLVFEYLIRFPLVQGLTKIEEYYVIKRVERIFTWRDGKSGVYPTFLADFGLRPAVGLTTFHRDLFVRGNTFTAAIGTWGPRWLRISAANETLVLDEDTGRVELSGFFDTRPDQPFYGVGPATSKEDEVRFQWSRWQVGGRFLASLGGLSRLQFGTAFRHVDFLDDPIDPPYDPTRMSAPGFDAGSYEILESEARLKIDTRDPDTEFKGGTGYLLELFGTFAFDPSSTSRNYVRWGAETAVFYDFTERGHVLALRLSTEIVEETGGTEVPFTELASLGGLESMRGFLPRRFVGDSAVFGTLSYRYPVWSMIDAEVFSSVGNVFDDRLQGFALTRLYLNSGIGLRTNLDRDVALTFMFAVGSNRFDGLPTRPDLAQTERDFRIESYRVVFGLTQGF